MKRVGSLIGSILDKRVIMRRGRLERILLVCLVMRLSILRKRDNSSRTLKEV